MNTYDLVLTIEKEVEKYYMEQAEKNKDESLKKVF
ncbi:MAG: rubrerythrin, partial [Clostridiales bacterium]|nr:rubrerythrin [Clostridiales bacterium]